ncbi:MAG: hypothetical protein WC444_06015 [Candidatus Paceibacterota bacterium]
MEPKTYIAVLAVSGKNKGVSFSLESLHKMRDQINNEDIEIPVTLDIAPGLSCNIGKIIKGTAVIEEYPVGSSEYVLKAQFLCSIYNGQNTS